MRFIINVIKGFFVGIAAISPGLSGGTLAVVLGIYEDLTGLVSNFFKEFKKTVAFALPVGLGSLAGLWLAAQVLSYFFDRYYALMMFLFIGLMLGTGPSLFKEANQKGFKRIYLLPMGLAFAVTALFGLLGNSAEAVAGTGGELPHFLVLVLFGAVVGFGTVAPGVSSTFMLLYLGGYDTVMSALKQLNLAVLLPVGVGLVISLIVFSTVMNFLYRRFYSATAYTVLGLVAGSMLTMLPYGEIRLGVDLIYFILLLLGGAVATYLLMRWNDSRGTDAPPRQEQPE